MSKGKEYQYTYIDRARDAQDDWYLQRRKEISSDDFVQTQLEISEPGDTHEQEADRIAQNIVNGQNSKQETITPVSTGIQTKSEGSSLFTDSNFTSQLQQTKGAGQPLDKSIRNEMESKTGSDLSGVKVHTGSAAHALSESINAKAFTHGQDVYFKNGNYDTNTDKGKELLAHEVVHTVQQKAGVRRQIQRSPDGDKAKKELKIILDKKKADNAVKAHQYLKSLSPDVRQEVYDDNEMAKWITWMDENLPVQYLESLDFGFDAGLDKSELTPPDGDTILVQLFSDDATWKEPVKLELLVMMVTQAGLQTAFVPVLQKQWDYLTPEIQAMLKRNGYDNTGYIGKTTGKLTETSNSRMIGNYLFQSGARSLRKGVVGNYLGIGNTATLIGFSLPMFQKSMGGHVSGVHMSDSGETTTKKELKEQGFKKGKYDPEKYVQTSGTVSLHFDRNEGLFFLNAFDLPFDSMNYQFEDQTVRVGKGTIKKANAKYYWEGKKGSSGNEGKIDVDELVLNNIRSIAGDTTIGIGRLALKTLSITVNQPLGNWQTLPSFYEATLACLDQLLNVLFITMDSGLILADHFFKGVGAGANTELQQLVNSMSSALGMTISFDGLILESLVHNKYAFVNKIELGKTDLLFGTDAYITGYNKSIQRIKQKAADEKRELRPEEQAEIDSLQKAIDNEYRIVELSRLVKAVDAKKSADYEKNQQELDSLLAGRQMAFSITTSLFEVGGVRTRSDATRFDLNMASLQSLNVTSTIGSNGLTTINADWGRSEIGHGENIVDPIGAKYKDETQNYKVGTTMDSGAFRWQEGQGHVLRMKNPVFYSGAIGIGPETVVDMEFQRKDITRTTLEMPFVGMPFLKAEEIVLTWPPNGDMLPDVEVWRPEVKDVELVTTQEISISPKQYIDEFYKEKSEEERAKLLKGQVNPVVIWQMSDVLRVSGKIDGKLKLVRNFENQQWILELSSEKEKVSFIGVHIVSEPRGDGMTPTGHRLDTQHFFNDDEDTPYPMKPSYKSKGATETQGETNDKYKFLDDLKNTAISISAFGKTVSIKADDGGFISPVAALNQIYAGFMDEFERSPIKRNIRAAIRRMAQHLSGSIEPSFTSWALGWSESEAYSILSTPLSMMDQLRFGTVVSGGYYQLAVYIGGVLRSKTKLAIGDNNTLSKDKTKVRLSAFAEYMTQTSKEEKKAEKYDMVSEALNGALDAFAKEWNDYTLDSHIKYSVNYEEPSQAALVQMIDEWWAQAWPVLAAIAPYAYTNYLMGMIAPSMINSLVKMVATSKPAVHFTSDFSFEGAVGMGTFDLSMDSKFNPQVGISDLTIPQLDKSFGDYHVNLTGFEMHGGLLQTNNWNFAKKDFTCTDASLKTFRLTFPIQKKSLSIGSTSDPLEHEADTIASKVASGQNADLTGVQRFFSGVQRKEQEEEVPLDLVQSLESVSGGQNMDEATRNEMESKMGVDFSGVKIHTNSNAHSMNEQVNAKAFTYGQNIFFRNGNYNPNSQSGKELLAHELVHTVQQSGSVDRKIQRSPLAPRQFADRHFKGVKGYSWKQLQVALGSDGTSEENEKLEILLSSLIGQNPALSPLELWEKIVDPAQLVLLNGYNASIMYTEGSSQLPQYNRNAGTLTKEADPDSGMQDLQTGTIEYTKRKHFIFGKKKRIAQQKAASDQATTFLQQTATKIDAIVVNANNSKHQLEADLQNMQNDLNAKLLADGQAKEQQTFDDITKIREDAIKAKDDMRRYYYGSLTVIRINTEKQKDKLQAYANDTIAKLNELENTQDVEIQNLYNTFNAHVEQIEGERNQEAYRQGANRTTEIYANSNSPLSVKSKQQVGIFVEVYKVQNEISTLADKTKQEALGTVPNSSFNNEAEYKANLSKQQAITDINTKVENTNALLDQRALADNQVAKSIRDKYDQMIDTQAIAIIETLTKSLQVYYGKLNEFGALQDAAIQSFYSKSVADLNAAYTTQVQQSKTRLEAFKTSQTGLKTPKKKKLPEDISLASADIDPLVNQANANVGNVVQANTTGLADLNTAMQTAFITMSQRGTSDLNNLMTSVSEELEATRLKGIDEQMRMREVHLRQIMRDVKGSQKTLDQEIAELSIVYQEQLAKLDDDLQKELDQFKTDSKVILDGLNEKMDAAIIAADVSSRAKLIYDALNKQPFKKAELLAALNGVSPSIVPALRREYDEKYSPLRKNRSLFDDIYYEMSLDYQGLFDVFCRLLSPTEPLNLSEGGTQNLATFVSPEYLNPEIASQLPAQKKGTAGLSISVKNPETMSGINETVPSGSSFIVAVDEIGYSFRAQGTSAAELKLALVKKPNGSLFANSRVIEIEDAEVGVYDFIYLMDKDGVVVPFRIQQKVMDIAAAGAEMMSDPDKVTGEDYSTYFARLHEQKQKIGGGVVREQNFTSPYISLTNQYMDNPSDRQFLPDKNGYQIVQPTSGCTYKWYARQTSTGATYDTHWKPDYVDPSQNKIIYDQAFTYLGTGNSVGICLDMQGHLAIVAEEYNAQGVPTGVFVNYLQYVLVERTYYFNEDNPYEEDPQGEVVALRQIETAISDSREYIKKITGTPVAVKTGYINTESGTQMSLPIFVGKSANPGKGKYVLVDLLPGQKDRLYYGDSIQACIDQFDSYNVYPEGMIFMEVMANDQGFPLIKKNFVSDGRTPWELFTTTTGWISIGLFIVGAAASLVPGGQGVGAGLIYASIAVGAVSALSSIYDESQKGEPDTGKIIIDTIMLAGSICALGGAAFKALNVANARPIVGKVGLFLEFAGAYSLTGTGVFLSAQGVVQIQEILASDLPLSEKIARISQILFFLGAGMWLFAKAAKALQNKLINRNLINELKSSGIKFSESDLRMICKDADGKIVFLESGNSNAGLQHIIERHWNPKELMKYFKNQDEMIQKIHSTVQNDQYISKQTVTRNGRTGLEYTYGINVDGGVKTFKLAVGSNGYVVTFYPQ